MLPDLRPTVERVDGHLVLDLTRTSVLSLLASAMQHDPSTALLLRQVGEHTTGPHRLRLLRELADREFVRAALRFPLDVDAALDLLAELDDAHGELQAHLDERASHGTDEAHDAVVDEAAAQFRGNGRRS